jgi:phosphoglycerate-specific signal transduction histidine kinase
MKWIEGFSPRKFPARLVWLLVLAGGTLAAFAAGILVLKKQVNLRTLELSQRNEELLSEITERKRAEKETLQVQLIQSQKMEAIGTLAGGIAHDFKNSMQAISSYVQLMKLKKTRDAQDSDYLNNILNSLKNANNPLKSCAECEPGHAQGGKNNH